MFFFLLGTVSLLGQMVLLREAVNLLAGNEFFYSLSLGFWLLLVAFGCLVAKEFSLRSAKWLYPLLLFCFGLIPLLVVFLRFSAPRLILPSFWQAMFLLLVCLIIFCPPLGWLFVSGRRLKKWSLNRAYWAETLGFFGGGLLFSLWLARTSFPLPGKVNQLTLKRLYPRLKLVTNSPYQQIIQTEEGNQKNFYLSGQLAFSSGGRLENELLAGLAFSFISSPQRVLFSGSPYLAATLADYPLVTEINFVEVDPLFLSLEKEFLPDKIKTTEADLAQYLISRQQSFDLVIINPPLPSSLFLNRYYTQEFFSLVKKSLKKKGVLVIIFSAPTAYQGEELLRLGRSIYQTFTTVFPQHFLFTPEDQFVLVGSQAPLEVNPKRLSFLEKFYPSFSQTYFEYQQQKLTRNTILARLKNPPEKINSNFSPVGFFYHTLFWQTLFNFRLPKIMYHFGFWLPLVLLILGGVLWQKNRPFKDEFLLVIASSFILLSLQILLIFLFQIKVGLLYSQLALLFALVLLGMASAVWWVEKNGSSSRELKLAFGGYGLVILAFFLLRNYTWPLGFWWLLAFFLGSNGGIIFATVSRWLRNESLVYVFDLLGAFGGAVFSGIFLFPFWGLSGLSGILIFLLCWVMFCLRKS